MADYNVYYYFMSRPQPVETGTSGPVPSEPEALEEYPLFQDFITRYTAALRSLFERSIPHHNGYVAPPDPGEPPAAGYVPWTVNVRRIPDSSPGVPNFSGLTIEERDPIVYLCRSNHDYNNVARRRASYAMLTHLRDSNWEGIPESLIRERVTALSSGGDIGGMAVIPMENTTLTDQYQYCPLIAEVFTNLTPVNAQHIYGNLTVPQMANNWPEIMAELLSRESFHEIAHCKAESYNRGSGTTWASTRSDSIHDEDGAGIISANITYQTSTTDSDFRVMGRHMMCPGPFYRLDQPICAGSGSSLVTQCRNLGQPHTLTAAPPPAAEVDPFAGDPLDTL